MLRRGFPVEPANGPGFCEVAWDEMDGREEAADEGQMHQVQQQQLSEQSIPAVLQPGQQHQQQQQQQQEQQRERQQQEGNT